VSAIFTGLKPGVNERQSMAVIDNGRRP